MRPLRLIALCCLSLSMLVAGCPSSSKVVSPFLAYAEEFGFVEELDTDGGGTGSSQTPAFREPMTITFRNNHSFADANVSFVAWVGVGSIRSAEQQDALLADGYSQLAEEVYLGTAFALPVGTFVYEGGGTAGASALVLGLRSAVGGGEGEEAQVPQGGLPSEQSFTFITPDAILAFSQPPVSCDSVAFYFSQDGEPLTSVPVAGGVGPFAGATRAGGFKTLAQVDVYQCDPFRPGLFLQLTSGTTDPNEYFEGDEIIFEFNEYPDINGDFANVIIGGGLPGN